jgi:hypothetical protein
MVLCTELYLFVIFKQSIYLLNVILEKSWAFLIYLFLKLKTAQKWKWPTSAYVHLVFIFYIFSARDWTQVLTLAWHVLYNLSYFPRVRYNSYKQKVIRFLLLSSSWDFEKFKPFIFIITTRCLVWIPIIIYQVVTEHLAENKNMNKAKSLPFGRSQSSNNNSTQGKWKREKWDNCFQKIADFKF